MFSGITSNNIDSKGRIVLPARFREELGDSFIITRGFLDCIQVLSIPEFVSSRCQWQHYIEILIQAKKKYFPHRPDDRCG